MEGTRRKRQQVDRMGEEKLTECDEEKIAEGGGEVLRRREDLRRRGRK